MNLAEDSRRFHSRFWILIADMTRSYNRNCPWPRNAVPQLGDTQEWKEWLAYRSQQSAFTSQDLCKWVDEYLCTCSNEAWDSYWRMPDAKCLVEASVSMKQPPPCGCPEWGIEAQSRDVKTDIIRTELAARYSR